MKAAVLSDGGWGTALAMVLADNGHDVVLWGRTPDHVRGLEATRENARYLPGVSLPDSLSVTSDLSTSMAGAELVVLAPPAQHMGELLCRLREERCALAGATYVSVSKGIEIGSLRRMSELVSDVLGSVPLAVLSGPSHAEEVARRTPTAVVVASMDSATSDAVQGAFMNDTFRIYTTEDVPGVELAGALKNVYALAAGVCDGMDFGDNTKAALMTRAIAEMARLGRALGGRPETFAGLSGVGDLIVTCMSRHSRNRYVGEQLGKGRVLEDIRHAMGGKVAEGVATAKSAYCLAARAGVETPITDEIYAALYEGRNPLKAVHGLMTRKARAETE